ncbi:hypothetical protein AB0K60_34890, partial [Thermopolyspora sp. NPDC052614]
MLDDRYVPAELVPWETSGAVRGLLGLPIADDSRHRVLGAWARIEPFLGDADPISRAVSLEFVRTATDPRAPGTVSTKRPGHWFLTSEAPLHPRWARWELQPNVLVTTPGQILSIEAFTDLGGRTLLATGGEDGTVRVWDAVTGTARAVLTGHTGRVWAVVAFSGPGGRTLLATGGSDGMVRV